MKEYLQGLDTLNVNLGSGEMVLVNFILAFVMFGVALSIRVSTFKNLFKKPKSVTLGLMLQWFALPALTCLVATFYNTYGGFGYDTGGVVSWRKHFKLPLLTFKG